MKGSQFRIQRGLANARYGSLRWWVCFRDLALSMFTSGYAISTDGVEPSTISLTPHSEQSYRAEAFAAVQHAISTEARAHRCEEFLLRAGPEPALVTEALV